MLIRNSVGVIEIHRTVFFDCKWACECECACVKSGGNLKDKSTFRTLELYKDSLQLTHWEKSVFTLGTVLS